MANPLETVEWTEWKDGPACTCGGTPVIGKVDTRVQFEYRYRWVVMCSSCSAITTKCTWLPDAIEIWKFEFCKHE